MPLPAPSVTGPSARALLVRWLAGALASEAVVLAAIVALGGGWLWIGLTAGLTGIALYVGLGRAVAAPLTRLLAEAERARAGHQAAEPLQVSGGGLAETDRLAALVNAIGHDHFESRRQLQETANHANAALVATVEQLQARTAELNQKTAELECAVETINQLATTDSLTGLRNRRHFDERLGEVLARAQRYAEPTALILIDVDKFKQINDGFGHAAGDAVLAALGAIIGSRTRSSDVSARLGGDEFAFVLPRTNLDDAEALARNLLAKVEAHEFRYADVVIPVTLSIGVGHFPCPPRDAATLFKTADEALYAAKHAGRNRVAVGVSA